MKVFRKPRKTEEEDFEEIIRIHKSDVRFKKTTARGCVEFTVYQKGEYAIEA